jgi:hypothetical protein
MALTQVSPALLNAEAQAQGFRNRIINGDMRISQAAAGASITPASSGANASNFAVDRFRIAYSQNSKLTAQQNAGSVTPPTGFKNYLGVSVSTTATVGASDYFLVGQAIEGFNLADLEWGTANAKSITISFWAYSNTTGTFGGAINNSAYDRAYPFTYAISSANTWEYKTVSLSGDTTGTWLTTNGVGAYVWFSLGTGSSRSTTASSWASGEYYSATGATSLMGSTSNYLYITGVQLEVGSVATEFERRPYGTELALCQRYFQTWGGTNNYELMPFFGIGFSTNTVEGPFTFIQPMRAAPTLSTAGTLGFLDVAAFYSVGTLILDSAGLQTARVRTSTSSGITQYRPYQLLANNSLAARIQLSSEL